MSHLDSIGFQIESSEAFEALMSKVFEEGKEIAVEGGSYIHYRDASGAELYAQLDKSGKFLGFMPFYNATVTRNLQVEQSLEDDSLTALDCRYFAKSQNETYPFVFDVVNGKERPLERGGKEALAFVAFPTEIDYFATAQEFLKEMPDLSATYFIPVGLMTPEGEANDNPEPYAMFIAQINTLELKKNSYSSGEFYVLEVSALEGDLTIVVSKDGFKREPQVGGFVNGVYWMGAKV